MCEPVRQRFGATPAGEPVEKITLSRGKLSCSVLTLGATLQSLVVPDRAGRPVDVVLGYESLEEYLTQDGYLGAVVGRYANRIAKGRFSLEGREYALAVNNGPNHLHGGLVGFSHRVWTVEELTGDALTLSLFSPDGEEGYPGDLWVRVTYALTEEALELRYWVKSGGRTVCNLTNHSYFNLSGQGSGPVLDQEVALRAERYTPADPTSIPTGQIAPVAGTPMDLREPTPIGAHIGDPFDQLRQAGGYDHNYVIDGEMGSLRPFARCRSPRTGIVLLGETTMPGVQFYTANFLQEGRRGKDGAVYAPRHAFCLETQFYPDAPNQPRFPSPVLLPGQESVQITRFAFQTEEN